MKMVKVNEKLSVSGQIEVSNMERLLQEGVQVILCNRPDGEEESQPMFADLAEAASAWGMEAVNAPFKSGEMPAEHVDEMKLLQNSGLHIHAFCRTGNRSFNLYAATQASLGRPKEELLLEAEHIGINVNDTIAPYYKDAK